MKRCPILMLVSIIILLTLTACQISVSLVMQPRPTSASLEVITLPVGYIPNIQFAPLYVAMDQGYFKDAGLELKIDYSFETDAVALVGANKLQFAVVSGEQVPMARAQGLPLVYVAAWYQQYPVGITALKDSGITKPADLRGKKIGTPALYGASYVGMNALLQAAGLKQDDITLDTIGFNQIEALVNNQEQAVVTYVANEPVQLAARGYEAVTIKSSDYLKLVSNGLVTNEATIKAEPAKVKAMVKALLKGMQFCLDNPDEAFRISTHYVENLSAQETIQKQVLAASMELWKAERLGYSDPLAWQNMQDLLLEIGFIKQALPNLAQAYSNDFLPERLK